MKRVPVYVGLLRPGKINWIRLNINTRSLSRGNYRYANVQLIWKD